ncbi:hypothetical protein FQZ97_1038130 [compost metagenome]
MPVFQYAAGEPEPEPTTDHSCRAGVDSVQVIVHTSVVVEPGIEITPASTPFETGTPGPGVIAETVVIAPAVVAIV